MNPNIVTLTILEYKIDIQPDYKSIGSKVDIDLAQNFEGKFLLRALGLTDHQQLNLDEFTDIIVKSGTDKYDPNRKGIHQEEF